MKSKAIGLMVVGLILVFNYVVLFWLSSPDSGAARNIIFNLVNVFCYACVGWILSSTPDKGLPLSMMIGAMIYFFSHVILRFLYVQYIYQGTDIDPIEKYASSIDVTIYSFLIFLPVVLGFVFLGRYLQKKIRNNRGKINGIRLD